MDIRERIVRRVARELHDEFAQSVTAIRSLARTVQTRLGDRDATSAQATGMIADEAHTYASGHFSRTSSIALCSCLGLA